MIYQYHKLVRDKIPKEIEEQGKKCSYYQLEKEAYQKELDKKLLEEANEWIADHNIEEMADLIEVQEKQENKKEDDNRRNKQQALWDNLQETNTLREIQQYIKAVNTLRGFEEQPIQDRMLLLTEEIGELAKSIRKNATDMSIDINKQYSYDSIESEVSDCFYVLASVCNKLDIDMFRCLKEKEKENIHRVWKK